MNTVLWFVGIVVGTALIGVVVFWRSYSVPLASVDLDVASVTKQLDEQTQDGHVYTLLLVTTGLADKADFVVLYKDAEILGDEIGGAVSLKDALWYSFVEPPVFVEMDLEQQTVTITNEHAEIEIYQLPPVAFE